MQLEMVRGTPNEFYLYLARGCYVRLRAESNTVRDIIVLTLRAFCHMAVADESTHAAVARGLSPMLTLRKLAQEEEAKKLPPVGVSANFGGLLGLSCMLRLYTPSLAFDQQTQEAPPPPPPLAPLYDLPWNRSASNSFSMDPPESTAASTVLEEVDDSLDAGSRRQSLASLGGDGWQRNDDLDDSLLLDAEALIGNAHKMGIQYQILPRAPKRISILDVPDLQIIEAMEALSEQTGPGGSGSQQEEENLRQLQRDQRRRRGSGDLTGGSDPEDNRPSNGNGNNVDGSVGTGRPEVIDASCIDKAIEDFMTEDRGDGLSKEVEALRERYVAIFCALQRELHTYKQRVVTLSKQLEEKQELNASFRKDIESLRSALTSMQLADKVYDLVTTDLQQLVKRSAAEPAPGPQIPF
jgi:hypothetical protein